MTRDFEDRRWPSATPAGLELIHAFMCIKLTYLRSLRRPLQLEILGPPHRCGNGGHLGGLCFSVVVKQLPAGGASLVPLMFLVLGFKLFSFSQCIRCLEGKGSTFGSL